MCDEAHNPASRPPWYKRRGMSWADRISILVAASAVVATLGVGTCSTNARFDDVNRRIDDVNRRIDDANTAMGERLDAIQADIRELRALVIDAIKRGEPAD